MKINPILPILDTHPAKEITKKTEQTRKNAENNNHSTNRKELYDVITNVIGDSGMVGTTIDKNYKSEYGYIYEFYNEDWFTDGRYTASSFDNFKSSFEALDNKYQSIKERILNEYQGEEQTKRLASLEKDYQTSRENKIKVLEKAINYQLNDQAFWQRVTHIDRRVHARARGEIYDETPLKNQLKQIDDKRSQYQQMFAALRSVLGQKKSHDLVKAMIGSLTDCLLAEEKNCLTMASGISNEKVSELSQLTSAKNRLFLEYSDRIFLSDQEKYQAFLEYSKKVKPLNEKIEQLKKEIAQTEE